LCGGWPYAFWMAVTRNPKWTNVTQDVVAELTTSTGTPGAVFPVGTNAVPPSIRLPGAVSYYVSSYVTPVSVGTGMTVGGEQAVIRAHDNKQKAYVYLLGTSTDGQVFFNGPHFHSTAHHFAPDEAVPIERLFGHVDKVKPSS